MKWSRLKALIWCSHCRAWDFAEVLNDYLFRCTDCSGLVANDDVQDEARRTGVAPTEEEAWS